MHTILCIDDDTVGLRTRKMLLESEGYRIIQACSGKEGLEAFCSEPVDIVIVDYWMSDMKGTALADEIKKVNPKVPIIMLSGYGELPGESVGVADRWIRKGQGPEYLLDAIRTLSE